MALTAILDDLKDTGDGQSISLGSILDAFEQRSLGVLLTLFAAIAALPIIGGIPGMSSLVTGSFLIAIFQSLFADGGLWAPERARNWKIDKDKVTSAVDKAKPVAKWIDKHLKKRWEGLIEGKIARWTIIACSILLALTFYPLALIPWGVQPPALAILAFGLALLGKDGFLALAGYAFTAATVVLLVWIL
ncbi:MAG: exopolysaccharide biosynthesis protein [Pseudomonadota bacterium]